VIGVDDDPVTSEESTRYRMGTRRGVPAELRGEESPGHDVADVENRR
jgi:hypothetical protein